MCALDVRPEVARLREALGATLVVASIRQVVGVRALVRRQVARGREDLATALVVASKYLGARVHTVLLEITSPEEALVATIVRAGKRVFGKYRQLTMHRVRTGRARDRDVHVGWKVTIEGI